MARPRLDVKQAGARLGIFLAGAVSVGVILVALMAAGVLPVKVSETRIVSGDVAVIAQDDGGSSGVGGSDQAGSGETSADRGTLTPAQIYERSATGVVEVLATFESGQGFFGPQSGSAQALGSGFVVSEDGDILTNAHVVESDGLRADAVTVTFKDADGQSSTIDATIVGVDQGSDVALLKVDPKKAGTLHPLELGDSEAVKVGEPVVAIGNPLGYDFTLTEGIVSAVDRSLEAPNGMIISNGIQTDAAINEGNSGGPLIDSSGRVIGINEQIASQSGGSQGLGFAVPIDTAIDVMKQLKDDGRVSYAWLGIQGQTITAAVAEALGLEAVDGVLVVDVTADVITAFDGAKVTSMDDLVAAITEHKPGDEVEVTIVRDGETRAVRATLSERPAEL
jgi:S1-C subfamily serine protease